MNIRRSTSTYEKWLAGFMTPIPADLQLKHEVMRSDLFPFFRATFYRWAEHWRGLPAAIRRAPAVRGIGDTHVENFGTWRDSKGRLVWGVNDFDEGAVLPFTNDLVRLAVSALLARHQGSLWTHDGDILDALLAGYSAGLKHGGAPFVLEDRNVWLRTLALKSLRSPPQYWEKRMALDPWRGPISRQAARLLQRPFPDARTLRVVHRTAGAGSLGRPRLAAIFEWRGGLLAREIKARVPSAWTFARELSPRSNRTDLPRLWEDAVRCQNPSLRASGKWIVRRLAPECSRIDLASLPTKRRDIDLLRAMGWEIASIHLGSTKVGPVRRHLESLAPGWLAQTSESMLAHVHDDFHARKGSA